MFGELIDDPHMLTEHGDASSGGRIRLHSYRGCTDMASNGKKKTTMAKLTRESKLRERRLDKQAKKDARKRAAADPLAHAAVLADDTPDGDGDDGVPTEGGHGEEPGTGIEPVTSGTTNRRSNQLS